MVSSCSEFVTTHGAGVIEGFVREVFYTQTNTYQFVPNSGSTTGPNLVSEGPQVPTGLGDCLNPAHVVMPTIHNPDLPPRQV